MRCKSEGSQAILPTLAYLPADFYPNSFFLPSWTGDWKWAQEKNNVWGWRANRSQKGSIPYPLSSFSAQSKGLYGCWNERSCVSQCFWHRKKCSRSTWRCALPVSDYGWREGPCVQQQRRVPSTLVSGVGRTGQIGGKIKNELEVGGWHQGQEICVRCCHLSMCPVCILGFAR